MTDEATTQRPLVKDMDTDARVAYLAGLVGQQIRYATLEDVNPLFTAYGDYAVSSIPWRVGKLTRLTLMYAPGMLGGIFGGPPTEKAIMVFFTPDLYSSMWGADMKTHTISFAELYDVEAKEQQA